MLKIVIETEYNMTLNTTQPRMTNLFEQLGLDASEAGIAEFIKNHQLHPNMYISEAPFWSEGQRALIAEKIASDDNWTIIVDQLNESLHEDTSK
jgi:hypothetical protein